MEWCQRRSAKTQDLNDSESYNLILTIYNFQLQIIYSKNQEDLKWNEERQLTNTNTDDTDVRIIWQRF